MKYFHVDVFTERLFSGNGLTVVFPDKALGAEAMLQITREFRQFETIFITSEPAGGYSARIFTMDEELPFAGHPMIGAAAVIHRLFFPGKSEVRIPISVNCRKVELVSALEDKTCRVTMNQGEPGFIRVCEIDQIEDIIAALNISASDLDDRFPVEVVSTGLPYLLVPLRSALEKARIISCNFERMLSRIGAKFVYLFGISDDGCFECRTWDNEGRVEDVATGSAAGPLAAYLVKNGFKKADADILIRQGAYAGRPSLISARVSSAADEVCISGSVAFFAEGEIY